MELRDREVSVKSEKAKGCRYQGLVKCRRSAKYRFFATTKVSQGLLQDV